MESELDYDRWMDAEQHCRAKIVAREPIDIPDFFFDRRIGWIEMIKTLRRLRGLTLPEAQREAVADSRWRKWVQRRVLADPKCALEARLGAREGKLKPFVELEGKTLQFLDV